MESVYVVQSLSESTLMFLFCLWDVRLCESVFTADFDPFGTILRLRKRVFDFADISKIHLVEP